MVEVSASILNVENKNAIQTLYNLETAGIDYFHIDVMDGKFVKNNTSNKMIEYCEYLNNISNMPLDVHLMVEDVENYIKSFLVFDPNIITIHLEAGKDKQEVLKWINFIKQNNVKVGISIKPNTNINILNKYLPYIDLVLVMSVEPGRGGQKFIEKSINRIEYLKDLKEKNNYNYLIEVDGGINNETISMVKNADIKVVGSYITNSDNYEEQINKLKKSK